MSKEVITTYRKSMSDVVKALNIKVGKNDIVTCFNVPIKGMKGKPITDYELKIVVEKKTE